MAEETKTTQAQENVKVDEEKTIWVKSGLTQKADGGDPLALYEQNEAHPNGEAFVAGERAVEVALTSEVSHRLNKGVLARASKEEMFAAKKDLENQAKSA